MAALSFEGVLAERAGREAGTLSGGEQQVLAIGRLPDGRPRASRSLCTKVAVH